MKIVKLFTVYDSKVGEHLHPQIYRTNGEAIRAFGASCADKNSQFSQFPTDFTLICVGEFEPESGKLKPQDPQILATASEFVKNDLSVVRSN